ncbi:MAG TPA: malate synthase A [Gemmatimonadaceae bacterium]|nr:malate synthase A [Gemmatimonadaceae bacterium]
MNDATDTRDNAPVIPAAASSVARGVTVRPMMPAYFRVLSPDALMFVSALQRQFGPERAALLERRQERQRALDRGANPDFLSETASVRERDWVVAATPSLLQDRRVEITGPTDRKMMINALNSGAQCFMADFEDSLSPTWQNVVEGQANLMDAVRGTLAFTSADGREYTLADRTAVLLVRPRGWHLEERHFQVDGEPVSASLFDFGLFMFHNAQELLRRGAGPYFYLPKLESHLEARLWNDVFLAAQEALGIPRGSIRATVLIETILAAFEMDEILHELRDHCAGLNAGRWDYMFSIIKKFSTRRDRVLPDRAQITMTVPFMRAYTELLVRTCHRRGAHAIGGMAAFIPSRKDARLNEIAFAGVRDDKVREAGDGFDGTWVAHPDLVPVARAAFDAVLGTRPNQKERLRSEVHVSAAELQDFRVPGGAVTLAGVRLNVSVALQYLNAWLGGQGAVGINNLMEDTATAEISRAQLWQWLHANVPLADGGVLTRDLYARIVREELDTLARMPGGGATHLDAAATLLDNLVLGDAFVEFLTIPASRLLPDADDDTGATG